MAEKNYKYGGDSTLGGLLLPFRREILSEEESQIVDFDDSGQAIVETIPAQYGETEIDSSYSPAFRGARSAGSFLNDIFFGDANEQSQAAGKAVSAIRGVVKAVPQMIDEQMRAAGSDGRYYDPETRRIVEFDPTLVMGGSGAGMKAVRNTPSNQVILGTMGSKTASYTPDQRRAVDELERQGMDTENLFLHGTSDDIRQPTSSKTGARDSGFIGEGFYGATPEGSRISDFYANTAAPRFRNEAGDYSDPNVFPYITKRGNYKQYSLMDKAGMGIVAQMNPNYSKDLTRKNIDEGFIGAEVIDADGSIIERVNYFPDTDTRSALNYDTTDLYSGARMQRAQDLDFDTSRTAYRGLSGEYDPSKAGNYQMFTSSPEDASEYGSNVVSSYLRKGNNLVVEGGRSNFNSIPVRNLPDEVRANLHSSVGSVARTDDIAYAAQAAGYDSVSINNVFDKASNEISLKPTPASNAPMSQEMMDLLDEVNASGMLNNTPDVALPPEIPRNYDPTTIDIIFDPKDIRSVNAEFDPARADSADLLSSRQSERQMSALRGIA